MPLDQAAYGLVHGTFGIVGAHAEGLVPPFRRSSPASLAGEGALASS